MDFVVADHAADGGRHRHDFKGGDQPSADGGDQLLRYDRVQYHGELDGDLRLLVGLEDVDDSVDGVGGADGVQGGEDQMAGLRRRHGRRDGFVIPHLAEEDDVGTLPEGSPQSRHIAMGVGADLPLADNALFMAVQVFQRVFQCDDVLLHIAVDIVDHARQRGRLTTSRGAGYQCQPLICVCQMDDAVRDHQLLRVRQSEGDDPDDSGKRTSLFIGADPKSRETLEGKGKIIVARPQERVDAAPGQFKYAGDQRLCVLGHEAGAVAMYDDAVDFVGEGKAGYDKNIGGLALDRVGEHIRNRHSHCTSYY